MVRHGFANVVLTWLKLLVSSSHMNKVRSGFRLSRLWWSTEIVWQLSTSPSLSATNFQSMFPFVRVHCDSKIREQTKSLLQQNMLEIIKWNYWNMYLCDNFLCINVSMSGWQATTWCNDIQINWRIYASSVTWPVNIGADDGLSPISIRQSNNQI